MCRERWVTLQDVLQSRAKKLSGAAEVHKFNRDAKDILSRIKVLFYSPSLSHDKVSLSIRIKKELFLPLIWVKVLLVFKLSNAKWRPSRENLQLLVLR